MSTHTLEVVETIESISGFVDGELGPRTTDILELVVCFAQLR